jgi:hypothetical protein
VIDAIYEKLLVVTEMDAAGNTVNANAAAAPGTSRRDATPGKVPAIEARPHRGLMLRWDWGDRALWPT